MPLTTSPVVFAMQGLRSSGAAEALQCLLRWTSPVLRFRFLTAAHFHSQAAVNPPELPSKWSLLQNGIPQGDQHTKHNGGSVFSSQTLFARGMAGDSNKKEIKQFVRNEDIQAPELRVVLPDNQHMIMTRGEALKYAMERSLDLILVSTESIPPVARVVEYNKFRHSRQQNERRIASATRTREKMKEPKEVRVKPRISDHDLQQKLKKVSEFLTKGHRVTIAVLFKGEQESKMAQEALHYIIRLVEQAHPVEVETAPVNASRRNSVAAVVHMKDAAKQKESSPKQQEPSSSSNPEPDGQNIAV